MNLANSSNTTYNDVLYDENLDYYNMTDTNNYGSNGYLKCFCQQVMFEADEKDKGSTAAFNEFEFYDGPTGTYKHYCKELISGSSTFSAVANYIATFVILLVNSQLALMMRIFVRFERPASKTLEVMSLTMKLFIAQYINTAILTLIINGDITAAGGTRILFGASGVALNSVFLLATLQITTVTGELHVLCICCI